MVDTLSIILTKDSTERGKSASNLDAVLGAMSRKVTQLPVNVVKAQLEEIIATISGMMIDIQIVSPNVKIDHMDVSIGFDASGKIGILGNGATSTAHSSIVIRISPASPQPSESDKANAS